MSTPKLGLTIVFLFIFNFLNAQNTQTIRGTVKDKTANYPIIGAGVVLKSADQIIANTVTDAEGHYRLDDIAYGKYTLEVSFMGYETFINAEVIVQGGNQTIIDVAMSESSFQLDEVELVGIEHKGDANNEFATISARTFSIQETERYAGSRGEPSRMAQNFAGVVASNDNSNDIVVRGNTPIGLLWRMDGINIPNPNHFAAAGNTGGPVTILNNQTLANSDFLTSAFPAEYGNTVAGVFDLKTRNGNHDDYEFSAELGFLGLKARAEGPFKKDGKASFLAAYRYSTFALINAMGIDYGTSDVPYYQDLNLKLNFPLKNHANLSIIGVGGTSKIDIFNSQNTNPNTADVYGDPSEDERFRTRMGVLGLNYNQSLSQKLFMQITASVSNEHSSNTIEQLDWVNNGGNWNVANKTLKTHYNFNQNKASVAIDFIQKLNLRHNLKYGVFVDAYQFNFLDSTLIPNFNPPTNRNYLIRVDTKTDNFNYGFLIQPYINWKWALNEKATLITGLHAQYFDVSNSFALEPRLALNYKLDKKQWIEAGFGSHSQMLPTYVYFGRHLNVQTGYAHDNLNVDFLKSYHVVLGYNNMLNPYLRLKIEAYYQSLYNVPVTVIPSSYSILNEGGDLERFFPGRMNNSGIGDNYGLEFTLEKFFNNNYFFMASGSIYSSTYDASDSKNYNTLFNSNYALNILGAREFIWGTKTQKKLTLGGKITFAGGRRYTPVDTAASAQTGVTIYDYSQRNSMQYDPYFRLDLNIKYRINAKRFGHEFGLDLVNILNTENPFKENYNHFLQEPFTENQLGFLPLFYYRIDF